MRAIVKVFVVGVLGLAVLFASPALSLAGPPPTPRVTFVFVNLIWPTL
jgi:hypothetical protein